MSEFIAEWYWDERRNAPNQAQREEIVRCGDCKHCYDDDSVWRCAQLDFSIDYITSDEKPNGFCAWGERGNMWTTCKCGEELNDFRVSGSHSTEPDPMEFARRFSMVLERSGLDMRDFASSIGCERKALIHWRQGKHAPGIRTLARICATYHVSADWLLGLDGGRDG